jgi:cytochrome c oxidase cbb3-type subunit 4
MDMTHEWYVLLSKSFGLFWLLGLSVGITAYAFWPSLGGRFDLAANSILDDEDGPAQPTSGKPEDKTCR